VQQAAQTTARVLRESSLIRMHESLLVPLGEDIWPLGGWRLAPPLRESWWEVQLDYNAYD
jgi:hypothetical protein